MAKPALGRGLGALLGDVSTSIKPAQPAAADDTTKVEGAPAKGERVDIVPLTRIRPCPLQPRKDFPEESLRELADSIRNQGIVQPLVVRMRGEYYELIAGERRWRAAQLAGLSEVPVLVREADDTAALEMALIENLQRENLNPIEEAQGYQQLIDQFKLRQEDVAAKVGKNRVTVANALRLLKLPAEVQAYLKNGQISVGHAKVILGLDRPEEQQLAAVHVIRDNLNVRQTEALVARWLARGRASKESEAASSKIGEQRDVHVVSLENRLMEKLGTKVRLRYKRGKGSVEIRFFSDDELERILQIIGVVQD
ncbi:MAG: ParB/RepB/Spo0J family partition protein [Verrucomicrobiota bacterium]|nr:ParB/RepB/Spo0J family partition protein [Verrucomicrobiota bacterium]